MDEIRFRNRRAVWIENEFIRLVSTVEGGHIAEILDKQTGISPLWIPPWDSIEPSSYHAAKFPEYGNNAESRLLAGIMGHNLCLDLFGPPSPEEESAGLDVHGEAGVLPWHFTQNTQGLVGRCEMPAAQLVFERQIELTGRRVLFRESVENRSMLDRPIAWTQHVTLGPPFLKCGATECNFPATKSRLMSSGAIFSWPILALPNGQRKDLRIFTETTPSGGYTTHLLDSQYENTWFFAYAPESQVVFGYVWPRRDFPWLGRWEENHSRLSPPWNGRTVTLGIEFGVSPIPESRREMIDRQKLFETPCYRWLPARSTLHASYYAAIAPSKALPESLERFEQITR